jgi:glycosyltransferase involved in cell wall biosynthesis
LFCGKFIPKKRPLDLVDAAQLLLRSHPELKVHLLFVGSGELGDELRAKCNVLFDADQSVVSSQRPPAPPASFAGFLNQTEISKAYVAADYLVLPSESETWGLTVNEAMASGLPAIIADAVGCAPDLITEGKTGFTFAVRNPVQLGERLAAIYGVKTNGCDFQGALAEKVRAYSLEKAVSGTLEAIRTVSYAIS